MPSAADRQAYLTAGLGVIFLDLATKLVAEAMLLRAEREYSSDVVNDKIISTYFEMIAARRQP